MLIISLAEIPDEECLFIYVDISSLQADDVCIVNV